MLVGIVVVLTCGLALALYLSRSFLRPVMELQRGARLIGDGDFGHRLKLDSGDELEELAVRFNNMATKLKASYSNLEERVRERTRELEESHKQLRRLFDGITDGISIIQRDYKIVDANKGIGRMMGKSETELKGSRCHYSYNGTDSPCPGCPAADTFKNGTASSAQISWGGNGKKKKEMEIYIFPLLEEAGKVTHVIEYVKDISDKKVMERKLFQSAKLAGIGTLAAGVAHEIRNPLGIIKTSADMVKKSSRAEEQNYELADFMIGEVDRLNRVVTRLLNFAKPSKPQVKPCDIHDTLEKALALASPHYRPQEVQIIKEYSKDIPKVLIDPEQLCQVFLNLIINAIQSMPAGGHITLSTGQRNGDTVFASVGDTGEGMDKKMLEVIFDPFFSTKEEGSGLGLAIVYRIIEAHKGHVEVKSAPGKGTTFTMFLRATT